MRHGPEDATPQWNEQIKGVKRGQGVWKGLGGGQRGQWGQGGWTGLRGRQGQGCWRGKKGGQGGGRGVACSQHYTKSMQYASPSRNFSWDKFCSRCAMTWYFSCRIRL
mmetsp:Transcript_87334/g.151994  ORF Transcript_87334/g.151994 Transcript_87334/m.151994 type:complete len:108 (-) Transcript_87334:1815-2138(-)